MIATAHKVSFKLMNDTKLSSLNIQCVLFFYRHKLYNWEFFVFYYSSMIIIRQQLL